MQHSSKIAPRLGRKFSFHLQFPERKGQINFLLLPLFPLICLTFSLEIETENSFDAHNYFRTTWNCYLQTYVFHIYCHNNSDPNLFKWLALTNTVTVNCHFFRSKMCRSGASSTPIFYL
jgi:hypothetical protein